MKKVVRLTESDLNRIVKRVVNEEETVPVTPSNKISPIGPKDYESVKGMVSKKFNSGETINITISQGVVKIDGLIKGNTGTLPARDITKILP
jgi:hypothetical protein